MENCGSLTQFIGGNKRKLVFEDVSGLSFFLSSLEMNDRRECEGSHVNSMLKPPTYFLNMVPHCKWIHRDAVRKKGHVPLWDHLSHPTNISMV